MITDEELANSIKQKVAELNELIDKAMDQELDVFIHQKFFGNDRKISVSVTLSIKL